tara:strand:+ start:544 stop:747 length:204 start_codon:yes stop_codon:yes gene_type:complete
MLPLLIPVIAGGAGVVTGWFANGETAEITENLSETADKTASLVKWVVIAGIVYLVIKNQSLLKGLLK